MVDRETTASPFVTPTKVGKTAMVNSETIVSPFVEVSKDFKLTEVPIDASMEVLMVKPARKTNFMIVQVRNSKDVTKHRLMVYDVAKANWNSSPVVKEFAFELVDFTYNQKLFVSSKTAVFVCDINTTAGPTHTLTLQDS